MIDDIIKTIKEAVMAKEVRDDIAKGFELHEEKITTINNKIDDALLKKPNIYIGGSIPTDNPAEYEDVKEGDYYFKSYHGEDCEIYICTNIIYHSVATELKMKVIWTNIVELLPKATQGSGIYGLVKIAGIAETSSGVGSMVATPDNLKTILMITGSWADTKMSNESKGIVQNKVIKEYVDMKANEAIPKTRTLAGISLGENITADELLKAVRNNATNSGGQELWTLLKNSVTSYDFYSLLYAAKDNEQTKNLLKEIIS